MEDLGSTQTKGLVFLPLVLGDAYYAACLCELPQGRHGKEADAAGTDDQCGVVGGGGRPERGVYGAGEGFDGYCGLVGHGVGYAVELRGVGDERTPRPAATRVVAEA